MYNEDTIEPEQRGHSKLFHKGKSASGGPSPAAVLGTGLYWKNSWCRQGSPKDSVVEESNYFYSGKLRETEHIKSLCKKKVYRK